MKANGQTNARDGIRQSFFDFVYTTNWFMFKTGKRQNLLLFSSELIHKCETKFNITCVFFNTCIQQFMVCLNVCLDK